MLPNDDLARWGEPPTDDTELAFADFLAQTLACELRGESPPRGPIPGNEFDRLIEMDLWMNQLIHTVLQQSGLLENLPPPAGPGDHPTTPIHLCLAVSRALPGGLYQPIASSHGIPMMVRDLRRVPDNPDRVTLRTGERIRIEVVCDRRGYLAILNVGPTGNLNMLYPDPVRAGHPARASEPLHILDIELIPPAGRERVFAIWTRQEATVPQLAALIRPGVVLRDMVRVQEILARVPEEDWHAVMLELDHLA